MNDELYRDLILEEYKHPRRKGALPGTTHTHLAKNPLCGDEITMHLRIEEDKVIDARFEGLGCAISQACASLFTDHLIGKTVQEISRMDEQVVLRLLGFTPNPMRMKCAVLALRATAGALGIAKEKTEQETDARNRA